MKPYVICHMMLSVDGRILPDRWHPLVEDRGVYERLHDELSLILVPTVEGVTGAAAVFDIHGGSDALNAMGMTLEHCRVLEGGLV